MSANGQFLLAIDTLVEMAAEDEPVLRAPHVPISGLNIAAAAPSMEIAKSIQKAPASSDVNRFLASTDSSICLMSRSAPQYSARWRSLASRQAGGRDRQGCEVTRVDGSHSLAAILMAREDKTRAVDGTYAETRLSAARAFLQHADISLQRVEGLRRNATVVSSAVLAGIAASDAACDLALGIVSADASTKLSCCSIESVAAKGRWATCPSCSLKTAAQYTGKSMAERQAADAI